MGKAGNYIKARLQQSHRRHAERAKRGALIKAQRRQAHNKSMPRASLAQFVKNASHKQELVKKSVNNGDINKSKDHNLNMPTQEEQEMLLRQWSQACRLQSPSRALCVMLHACLSFSVPKNKQDGTENAEDANRHNTTQIGLRYDVNTTLQMMAEALIDSANLPTGYEIESEDEMGEEIMSDVSENDNNDVENEQENTKVTNDKQKNASISKTKNDTEYGKERKADTQEYKKEEEEEEKELTRELRGLENDRANNERSVLDEIICDDNGRRVVELLLECLQVHSHVMNTSVTSFLMSVFEEEPELAYHYIACRVISGLVLFGGDAICERVLQFFRLEAANTEVKQHYEQEEEEEEEEDRANDDNNRNKNNETSHSVHGISGKLEELLTNRHTAGTIARLLECYQTETRRWLSHELNLDQANKQETNEDVEQAIMKESNEPNSVLLKLIENPVANQLLTRLLTCTLRVKLITQTLNLQALLRSKRGMSFLAALLNFSDDKQSENANENGSKVQSSEQEHLMWSKEPLYVQSELDMKSTSMLLDALLNAFGLQLYDMSVDGKANFVVQSILNIIPYALQSSRQYLQLFLVYLCHNGANAVQKRYKYAQHDQSKYNVRRNTKIFANSSHDMSAQQRKKTIEQMQSLAKSENWNLEKLSSEHAKTLTTVLSSLCESNIGIHVIIRLCEVTMKIDMYVSASATTKVETSTQKTSNKVKEQNYSTITKITLEQEACCYTLTDKIASLLINRNNIDEMLTSASGSMLIRHLLTMAKHNASDRPTSHLIWTTIARQSVELAYDGYGNLIVQEYLRLLSAKETTEFVQILIHRNKGRELLKMAQQQFASHVIFTLFELADSSTILLLCKALEPNIMELACHVNGRYIVEQMMRVSKTVQTKLADAFLTLVYQKGTQTILTTLITLLDDASRAKVINTKVKPHFTEIALHQNGSIVLQKIIQSSSETKQELQNLLKGNTTLIYSLTKNFYGKYVANLLVEKRKEENKE